MTTALGLLLSCIGGAALLVAVGTYFWVNRTPATNERFDKYGRVPLFGVELNGATPTGTPVIDPTPSAPVATVDSSTAVTASAALPDNTASGTIESAVDGSVRRERDENDTRQNEFAPPHRVETASAAAIPAASPADTATPPHANPIITPYLQTGRNGAFVSDESSNGARAGNGRRNGTSSNGHAGHDVSANGVPGSMIEGHNLRFSVPAEGTLQFLPGRFEVNSGLDSGREIRFVRVPGPDGTQVTFGRNEGPLYRHIQLRDQTVSREHARMTLVEGQWALVNLSRTNPVAHNGRILGFGESQELHDGDRVEMGEVVFNFRSR